MYQQRVRQLAAADQIEQLQSRVAHKLPEAVGLIFSAHLMILKDRAFERLGAGHIHVAQRCRHVTGGQAGEAILALLFNSPRLRAATPSGLPSLSDQRNEHQCSG